MSPGLVEDYVSRLARELRRRGIDDPRILAEAREHLVDAVEEGRQRGLAVDEAEREALERFGAPGIVAAHVEEERERMTGFSGALRRAWQRKWWILAPTALAAMIASVASSYVLPARYRAETTILVVPQRVPEAYIRSTVTTGIEDRLRAINQRVHSRTRLERIIDDFDLYADRRKTDTMQDIVADMRRSIDVDIVRGDVFRVAFTDANPRVAKDVTDRLATCFIEESLKDQTVLAEVTTEFLEREIEDVRRRIIEYEKTLKSPEAQRGAHPMSQADVIPYVVLQESYRELLAKAEDARAATNLERRQIGEQFRILDPARLPEAPEPPDLVRVTLIGALVGLLIGLVLVAIRRGTGGAPPALAEA
jgi:uncharacterized protein involved in exopolysaccharide biosynthesis